MSAISRAFTTRRVRQTIDIARNKDAKDAAAKEATKEPVQSQQPQRSKTLKSKNPPSSVRAQISGPLELVHTTNMLSYNAPDICRTSTSSTSAKSTDEDSDGRATAASTPPTSPDVESNKQFHTPPAPNHLSCYFTASQDGKENKENTTTEATPPVPAIPKRSPSHTKKASFEAVRQRSVSTMSKESDKTVSTKASFTFSRSSSASTTASSATTPHNSIGSAPKPPVPAVPPVSFRAPEPIKAEAHPHPFGRELAQVTEIAEEYGIKHSVFEEEEQILKKKGLQKFSADDYLGEVHTLFARFFPDSHAPVRPRPAAALWI